MFEFSIHTVSNPREFSGSGITHSRMSLYLITISPHWLLSLSFSINNAATRSPQCAVIVQLLTRQQRLPCRG